MAVYVGARVQSVTIEPDRDDGPQRHADIRVEWPVDRMTRQEYLEKSVLVALAGPVAEMLYNGDPYHPAVVAEWSADWAMAWEAAMELIRDPQRRMTYLEQATRNLYKLLDRQDFWAALAAIADNLLAHDTLEGEEVEEIVDQWLR